MRALYLSIIENVCIFRLYSNAYISSLGWSLMLVYQPIFLKLFRYSSTQRRLFAYMQRERENKMLCSMFAEQCCRFAQNDLSFIWMAATWHEISFSCFTYFIRAHIFNSILSMPSPNKHFSVKTISLHTISLIYIYIFRLTITSHPYSN